MNHLKSILIFTLLWVGLLGSMALTAPSDSQEKESKPVDVASYESKYPGFAGVLLEYQHKVNHRVKSRKKPHSWEYIEKVERRYLVLDPENEEMTTFQQSIPDNYYLREIELWITRPGGLLEFVTSGVNSEPNAEGGLTYKHAYPNVVKGSIITEKYRVMARSLFETPPFYNHIPLQFQIPCEKLEVSYTYPDWWRIKLKNTAPNTKPNVTSVSNNADKFTKLTYYEENVPHIPNEAFSPEFKEMANYLELGVTYFELGDIKYSSPSNWTVIAQQILKHAKSKARSITKKVGRTARSLTKGLTSDEEKLDTILTFVQKEIDLAPTDGSNQKLKTILETRKADVWDKVVLAHHMLQAVDLHVEILLVHSAEDGYFDREFIDARQLYSPALWVNISGKNYLALPYIEDLPYNYVPDWHRGQDAMVFSNKGFVNIIKLPKGNETTNDVEEFYDVKMERDGIIRVKERKTFHGAMSFYMRKQLSLQGDETRDAIVKELLTYSQGELDLESREILNLEDYKKPLVIDMVYHIDNLVTITPGEILFDTGGLFSPVSQKNMRIVNVKRLNPIKIPIGYLVNKKIQIRYPSNWELTTTLEPFSKENNFGKVERKVEMADNQLSVFQTLHLKATLEPNTALPDLLAIAGSHTQNEIPTLIFGVTAEGPQKDLPK